MKKTFQFLSNDNRDEFVIHLLAREDHHKHAPIRIVIEGLDVSVTLGTFGVNAVTEMDRDIAKFCDVLHKDVIYSHVDARN